MDAIQAIVNEITERDAATPPFMRVNSTRSMGKVLNPAPTISLANVNSAKTVEKTNKLPLKIPEVIFGMITLRNTW
jgi:hypothetical protein